MFMIILAIPLFLLMRYFRRGQLPPGPRGYPFIGNLLELSKARRPHLLFPELNRKYGSIVHISAFGKSTIIINTVAHATELLERRGSIYSDRPCMTLENEVLGWDAAMPSMRYGMQFRKHRRLAQALLNPVAVRSYESMHAGLAMTLLSAISARPGQFLEHILIYATSTIYKLAYDLDVRSDDHHLVRLANEAFTRSAELYQASGSLVDFFPSLKFIYTDWPVWAPFSGLRRAIEEVRDIVKKANHIPYNMATEKIRSGVAGPSLVKNAIDSLGGLYKVSADDEHDIMGLAGVLYGAGQETTTATLASFVLAMVRFPEVQRTAQEELDAVIPDDRLPALDDRPDLPYMEALLKELFRKVKHCRLFVLWNPPLITIPHATTLDDHYDGYYIPKGSSIIANLYDMSRACPRPEDFLPERFITGDNLGNVPSDPRDFVFGFGRRRCPGMFIADHSIWIATSQMLFMFNFLPEVVDGAERVPPAEFSVEVSRQPKPFNCRIRVRDGRERLFSKS